MASSASPCSAFSTKTGSKSLPRLESSAKPSHRYRRSKTTTAPRKRTFIAAMLKGVIERDAPAFSGAGLATSACKTLAVMPCRSSHSAAVTSGGGSGNGNNSKSLGWGDDHGDAFPGNHDDTAALALLAAAIVLGIAMCPITKDDLRSELVAPAPITTTARSATVNKDGVFSAGTVSMAPPIAPSAAELMAYAGLALIAAKRHSFRILCLYVVGIRM